MWKVKDLMVDIFWLCLDRLNSINLNLSMHRAANCGLEDKKENYNTSFVKLRIRKRFLGL